MVVKEVSEKLLNCAADNPYQIQNAGQKRKLKIAQHADYRPKEM